MKKTLPQNLHADWSIIESLSPWEYVTSAELAKVLGVHLQTINNWVVRGILKPEPRSPQRRGNKNYFRIAATRAWLEQRTEFDIIKDWVKRDVQTDTLTDGQVHNLLSTLYKVPLSLS